MHFLVTNDDGIQAPGLLALAQELRTLGKVSILAPDRNWSASGHVKTLERPLRVREARLADGSTGFSSDGAPSDCVALALLGFLPDPVDMVISGINPNANMGHDLTYSGTVTAAMEAAIAGKPGIAVSVDRPDGFSGLIDYGPSARATRRVVEGIIQHNPSEPVLLNINIPYLPDEELRGFRITRQGLRIYRDALVRREDPRGRPYYWIGGDIPTGIPEEGTDFGAIDEGYVSITPIQLDLTAYRQLESLRSWEW